MAIYQKLHTRLVQKLILTPSLQQAIKLLPMSTLELSELLNQEMVENPMLEEVPTEDIQPPEAQAEAEKTEAAEKTDEKNDTWDDQDYEYFFGDSLARPLRSRSFRRSRTRSRPPRPCPITCCGSSPCRPMTCNSATSARPSSAT